MHKPYIFPSDLIQGIKKYIKNECYFLKKKKLAHFLNIYTAPYSIKQFILKKKPLFWVFRWLLLGFCCKRSLFETQIKVDVSLISKEPVRLYLLRLRCQMQTGILFKFVFTCIFFFFCSFSFDTIPKKSSDFPNIYIPSSPHYFLFQIPSSRFLECNLSRAIYIETPTSEPNSTTASTSSEFNSKMLISLRELKTFFQNLLMNFWIHSGTLLGNTIILIF